MTTGWLLLSMFENLQLFFGLRVRMQDPHGIISVNFGFVAMPDASFVLCLLQKSPHLEKGKAYHL